MHSKENLLFNDPMYGKHFTATEIIRPLFNVFNDSSGIPVIIESRLVEPNDLWK